MFKKISCLLILSLLIGCSTPLEDKSDIENLDDTMSEVIEPRISITTNKVYGSYDFIDPLKHEVVWLVSYFLDDGSQYRWMVNFVVFGEDGEIWFFDKNANKVTLHKQYSLSLIQLNDWLHEDWQPSIEIDKNKEEKKNNGAYFWNSPKKQKPILM